MHSFVHTDASSLLMLTAMRTALATSTARFSDQQQGTCARLCSTSILAPVAATLQITRSPRWLLAVLGRHYNLLQ